MKGRKRKPAAIRELHGSRTRPHHVDAVPTDDDSSSSEPIAPPAGLDKAERVYWNQFAPLLAGARVLTPADTETLGDYCRSCVAVDVRGRRLKREMARRDLNQPLVRLLDAQVRGWIEKKTKLATELGLTAISRTRISWTGHHQRQADASQPSPTKPPSTLMRLQAQAAALRKPVGIK